MEKEPRRSWLVDCFVFVSIVVLMVFITGVLFYYYCLDVVFEFIKIPFK